MSNPSHDQLALFRAESDRAFLEMQQRADREMAEFLSRYGQDIEGGSPQASIFSPQTVLRSRHSPAPGDVPSGAAAKAEELYESVSRLDLGSMNRNRLADSVEDLRGDFDGLSRSLREESRVAARDAAKGTADILKNSASDLGRKAKEEAAALKAAMKQAMEEERNLKAMKGRAAEEARKAKERFQRQMEEAKDDVLDGLQGMAQDKLGQLRQKAQGVAEQGQQSLEREWNDFLSGRDTPQ